MLNMIVWAQLLERHTLSWALSSIGAGSAISPPFLIPTFSSSSPRRSSRSVAIS